MGEKGEGAGKFFSRVLSAPDEGRKNGLENDAFIIEVTPPLISLARITEGSPYLVQPCPNGSPRGQHAST